VNTKDEGHPIEGCRLADQPAAVKHSAWNSYEPARRYARGHRKAKNKASGRAQREQGVDGLSVHGPDSFRFARHPGETENRGDDAADRDVAASGKLTTHRDAGKVNR
jgi:hypothetical protein